MKNLQEKIDSWVEENGLNEREFFEWLQGCEYPGSEVEYNGGSGRHYGKKWYTLTLDSGEQSDFYL